MILTRIFEYRKFLEAHFEKLRLLILLTIPYFMVPTLQSNEILSEEALSLREYTNEQIIYKKIECFSRYKWGEEYKLNDNSPYETILIVGKLEHKNLFYKIVLLANSSKSLSKNIKIRLFRKKIEIDPKEQYFCVIKADFGNENFLKCFPLKNRQANSDLFFKASQFYDQKIFYSLEFLTHYPNNINFLEVQIRPSIKDAKHFFNFLRSISFFHSHSLGNYYYAPFGKVHISWESIYIFLILSVAYCGVSLFYMEKTEFKSKMFFSLLCLVSPWSFVLFLFSDYSLTFSCLAILSVVNFKVAYFYAVLLFLRNVFVY